MRLAKKKLNLKHVFLLKKIPGNHFLSKYLYIKRKISSEKYNKQKHTISRWKQANTNPANHTKDEVKNRHFIHMQLFFLEYNQRCLLPSQGRYPYLLGNV